MKRVVWRPPDLIMDTSYEDVGQTSYPSTKDVDDDFKKILVELKEPGPANDIVKIDYNPGTGMAQQYIYSGYDGKLKIMCEDKLCAPGKMEDIFATAVFGAKGNKVSYESILSSLLFESLYESKNIIPKTVLNIKKRINEKLLESFETPEVILCSAELYWIDKKYIK